MTSHSAEPLYLELLYTCLANLVHEIAKDGRSDLLEGLNNYKNQTTEIRLFIIIPKHLKR